MDDVPALDFRFIVIFKAAEGGAAAKCDDVSFGFYFGGCNSPPRR